MQISIANAIQVARRIGSAASIITNGLKMWLGFKTSEPLGREEVVNGDFATDLSGWSFEGTDATNTITWNNGRVEMIADGSTQLNLSQDVFEVGKTYKIELDAYNVTGAGFKAFDSGLMFTIQSDKHYEFYHTALSTSLKIYRNTSGSSSSGELDNISVKELTQITPDLSGNSNVGELYTGTSLNFNTNDAQSIQIDSFQMSGSNATFAFWIKPDLTTGFRCIFDVNPTRFLFRISSGNLQVVSGSTVTFGSIASDQWQRVVIVINGTSADAYINGVQSGVTQTITAINMSTATLARIGAYFTGGGTLDAKLSDFQIYNAVWSADDIAYDYAKPNHLVTYNPNTSLNVTNLKAYWALSEGDGLVAYDSGTNLEEDVVQNGDFSELGSEEVVNGDFATDSDWIKSPFGVTISGGSANFTSGQDTYVYQDMMVIGKQYKISLEYNISSISSGYFGSNGGSGSSVVDMSGLIGLGAISGIITASSTKLIVRSASLTGSITNVSVKQVDPNDEWTLGTGWSIGNNKITRTAQSGSTSAYQDISFTSGKSYSITYTLDVSAGSSLIRLNGDGILETTSRSVDGTYTEVLTASGNYTRLNLRAFNGTFAGSITNVSVREVTPSDHGGLINVPTWDLSQPRIPQLGMMDWAISTPVSDEVTLVANPSNPSQDILGNSVRLREKSLNLNGSGYAEVADSASINPTTAITIQCWIKYNTENDKGLVAKWTATKKDYMLYKKTNKFVLYIGTTPLESGTLPSSGWVNIAGTYNGSTMKTFINGVESTSQGKTGSIPNNDNVLDIGRYAENNIYCYSERISDVLLYDTALDADEILNNYNVGLPTHSNSSSFSGDFSSDYGN